MVTNVSGARQYPVPQSQHIGSLIPVGHGPQKQIWALVREQRIDGPLPSCVGYAGSSLNLQFATACSLLWMCSRAILVQAKNNLSARLHPLNLRFRQCHHRFHL